MTRLKANKTSLYKLVAEYADDLPPMRTGAKFSKCFRTPDYTLEWITKDWNHARAFFSACMGRPLLSIEIRDGDGRAVSRIVHKMDMADLRKRGMVEEFTTAAERGGWRGGGPLGERNDAIMALMISYTNPALQAFNEYQAAEKNARAAAEVCGVDADLMIAEAEALAKATTFSNVEALGLVIDRTMNGKRAAGEEGRA